MTLSSSTGTERLSWHEPKRRSTPPPKRKNPIAHFSIGRSGIFRVWTDENRQNARLTLDGHCRSRPFTTLFLHLNRYESQATESFRGDCVCRQFFADKTVRSGLSSTSSLVATKRKSLAQTSRDEARARNRAKSRRQNSVHLVCFAMHPPHRTHITYHTSSGYVYPWCDRRCSPWTENSSHRSTLHGVQGM